jgi:hypothetical protein
MVKRAWTQACRVEAFTGLAGSDRADPGLTTDQETPTLEHDVAATLVANGGRVVVANVRGTT